MLDAMQTAHVPVPTTLDDCWNRIGVRGNNTCPALQAHVRCLNCPTYAAAAVAMLDRTVADNDVISSWAASNDTRQEKTQSALIFRVGSEWLALPPQVITEVAAQNTIHSLPHQASRAVLGLVNIRGALVLCVSLAHMLHTDSSDKAQNNARLLVVTHQSQKLVFPVDEVFGIHRYNQNELKPAPTTLAHANSSFTRAVMHWNKHTVGLLDCDLLCYALNRSLT